MLDQRSSIYKVMMVIHQTFLYEEELVDKIIKKKKEQLEQMGMKKGMNKLDSEEIKMEQMEMNKQIHDEEENEEGRRIVMQMMKMKKKMKMKMIMMLNMDKMKIFQIKCLNEQKIIMEMLMLYFDFDMVMKKLFSHIINKMMKKVYLELLNTEVK
ncbi:MAG: hypothetical protein EZS28_046774, partial [Streblomastix strix]